MSIPLLKDQAALRQRRHWAEMFNRISAAKFASCVSVYNAGKGKGLMLGLRILRVVLSSRS
ncbi:MAG: hypothetical protein C4318_02700 [Acidimicrobiia bacterium]